MIKKERAVEYKEQTSFLYTAIGEYLVNFELVCFALRNGIFWMMNKYGLQIERVADIMLSRIHARQLLDIFWGLIHETEKLSKLDRKILNNIYKRLGELINDRNTMIHGTWFIGWANPTDSDFSKATLMRSKLTKKGISYDETLLKAEDIGDKSNKASKLYEIITRLSMAFTNNYRIESNFKFDENDDVIIPLKSSQ